MLKILSLKMLYNLSLFAQSIAHEKPILLLKISMDLWHGYWSVSQKVFCSGGSHNTEEKMGPML